MGAVAADRVHRAAGLEVEDGDHPDGHERHGSDRDGSGYRCR
jgi:hypothetical protein